VPVGAASAEAKLDRLVGGEGFESLLRLLDEGPGVVATPAERRNRRLGADQLDDLAIGKLECLAVEHGGNRCGFGRRQVAGPRFKGKTCGKQSRRRKDKAPLTPPHHDLF
jgi:hypothetical protein